MVRALLDGRKTETRRVVKPQPELRPVPGEAGCYTYRGIPCGLNGLLNFAPYRPGDILWVRETWANHGSGFYYKADAKNRGSGAYYLDHKAGSTYSSGVRWRPSIHMPREAARIFLRVTDVRVERLFDSFFKPGTAIFDLRAEGITLPEVCIDCIDTYGHPCCNDEDCEGGSECGNLDGVRDDFATLWDSTIKPTDREKYGWSANPYVWVISFEHCEKPEEWQI